MINYEWPYNHVSLCDLILFIITALQLNIIPLSVTMDRKIKKPLAKLNFWSSQKDNTCVYIDVK